MDSLCAAMGVWRTHIFPPMGRAADPFRSYRNRNASGPASKYASWSAKQDNAFKKPRISN